ncbi:hypothetical protein AMIS_81040 [Actinoplanes missouriensis 431]|uniref:Uncharacterized protein n=1 Tax=Actinoplanes missouriensis (strain ATCC 14538 / DSM 43046 / CBS 188.64 / JCM 3121 / NBRC 102363 / NCIMB 12654 / NRRL B-3342 / UNCC 431) TaxID=512565 RepID=I0HJY7_ACTM4|nr:hypothetical protein [Actinoplanes missouriensis]BAL93324.1 hypothetical protein AMIS_81040 [Actinoplanes missouriensis 431]
MRNLEDNLRDAVLDLADDAPPPHDLAAVARSRGRRIRRRRHATYSALAVALVAVTVTPYTVLRKDTTAPAPATIVSQSPSPAPSPTTRTLAALEARKPYKLLGGAVLTAMSRTENVEVTPGELTEGDTYHVLLDPATGHYEQLVDDYRDVVPGPRGLFAVSGGTDAEKQVNIVTARGEVRRRIPYRPVGDEPQWSPDGSRLLIPTLAGFQIVSLAGGTEPASQDVSGCPDYCSYSWLPNGTEIAVPRREDLPRSEAEPDRMQVLLIYSATTGKLSRSLPLTARPIGTRGWSPDERLVLTQPLDGGSITLTSTADGSPIAELAGSDGMFLPDGRILTIDDEFVMLYDGQGRVLEEAALPAVFRNLTLEAGLP